MAPYFSVYEEIKNEALIQVLPHKSSPDINLYAIYPKSIMDEQKINLLLNFFVKRPCQKTLRHPLLMKIIKDGSVI